MEILPFSELAGAEFQYAPSLLKLLHQSPTVEVSLLLLKQLPV
jgi:hypothetical protein